MKTKGRKPCNSEFFEAAEKITGSLSEQQRDAITGAVEHYLMCLEYHLDSRKSPAAVQKELEALATAAGELAKKVEALSREARIALSGQSGAENVVNDRDGFIKSLLGLQSAATGAIETAIRYRRRGPWSKLEAAFWGRQEPYKVMPKSAGPPHQAARELFLIDLLNVCEKPRMVERLLRIFVAHNILRRGEVPHGDAARKAIGQAQKSALNPKKITSSDSPL